MSGFSIHRTDLLCTVTSSCVDVADAEEARHAQVHAEFSSSLSDAVLAQKTVLSVFTTRDTPLQQHDFFSCSVRRLPACPSTASASDPSTASDVTLPEYLHCDLWWPNLRLPTFSSMPLGDELQEVNVKFIVKQSNRCY